jgi:hypothetical protein
LTNTAKVILCPGYIILFKDVAALPRKLTVQLFALLALRKTTDPLSASTFNVEGGADAVILTCSITPCIIIVPTTWNDALGVIVLIPRLLALWNSTLDDNDVAFDHSGIYLVVPPTILLAVVAKDDVSGVNVIDVAADDVSAKDDVSGVNVIDVAADAVFAKDAVPNNEPVKFEDISEAVNDPITTPEPDINTDPVN